MHQLIVQKGDTPDDKGAVIVNLSHRIGSRKKSDLSFSRMFGTQPPHAMIERLAKMNSRALRTEFNETIFRLLSGNPNDFYEDDDFLEQHNIITLSDWDDGNILDRWEKYTQNPNPHHILARSRGGSNASKNLWQADRASHDDFHRVFQNLTPSEQIFLILHRYKYTFSRSFQDDVQNILRSDFPEPAIYQRGVVNMRNFI